VPATPRRADPLDLPATPERVHRAAELARLSESARRRAIELAVATPEPAEWRQFLSRALAMLGASSMLAGVVCFVAYNWDKIGRFGKFGLLELAIIAATIIAWRKLPRTSGKVALFSASVLVGPLLAIYGQTYQTGADPYGLFLTWMLLIIPWTIAANFAALWILVIALADVSLLLFWNQVIGAREETWLYQPLVVAALHFAGVGAYDWQSRRAHPWLAEEWARKALIATGFAALFIPAAALVVVDDEAGMPGIIGVLGLGAAIAIAFQFYRAVERDRFLITVAVASGMLWITVLVGRVILDLLDLDIFGLFLMAAFVVFQITLGLRWYRRGAHAT
jgi:uncharacterized membrane protein